MVLCKTYISIPISEFSTVSCFLLLFSLPCLHYTFVLLYIQLLPLLATLSTIKTPCIYHTKIRNLFTFHVSGPSLSVDYAFLVIYSVYRSLSPSALSSIIPLRFRILTAPSRTQESSPGTSYILNYHFRTTFPRFENKRQLSQWTGYGNPSTFATAPQCDTSQ